MGQRSPTALSNVRNAAPPGANTAGSRPPPSQNSRTMIPPGCSRGLAEARASRRHDRWNVCDDARDATAATPTQDLRASRPGMDDARRLMLMVCQRDRHQRPPTSPGTRAPGILRPAKVHGGARWSSSFTARQSLPGRRPLSNILDYIVDPGRDDAVRGRLHAGATVEIDDDGRPDCDARHRPGDGRGR